MIAKTKRLFGTDGIRGVVNQFPITAELSLNLGRAMAYFLKQSSGSTKPRVVVGKDTRLSGDMLEEAFTSGLLSQGADVFLAGSLPTPAIAHLTTSLKASAGVVISASHNPYYDNGIKIFGGNGFKLPDQVEDQLEQYLDHQLLDRHRPRSEDIGKLTRLNDTVERYVLYLKNAFPKHLSLQGMTMVLDCAHGAAHQAGPLLFHELGATVHILGDNPSGYNINLGCGSLYPEVSGAKVLETKADLGLALDGDADRAIFVDGQGRVVDGDRIMNICAQELNRQGMLKKNTMVATIMSNMGLEHALNKAGINLLRSQVGDRYVVEILRQEGLNFGGEQSGHLVFLDHSTTGDGLMAGLQTLAAMKESGQSLEALADLMTPLPQVLLNVKIDPTKGPLDQAKLDQQITKITAHLGDKGRILVRPSGTEPLIRIMLEGQDLTEITQLAEETAALISQGCCP